MCVEVLVDYVVSLVFELGDVWVGGAVVVPVFCVAPQAGFAASRIGAGVVGYDVGGFESVWVSRGADKNGGEVPFPERLDVGVVGFARW